MYVHKWGTESNVNSWYDQFALTLQWFSGTSISLGDSTIAIESKDFVAS